MIGSPSEKDYMGLVSYNIIFTCPISVSDVKHFWARPGKHQRENSAPDACTGGGGL
jgi:hypothetical protein